MTFKSGHLDIQNVLNGTNGFGVTTCRMIRCRLHNNKHNQDIFVSILPSAELMGCKHSEISKTKSGLLNNAAFLLNHSFSAMDEYILWMSEISGEPHVNKGKEKRKRWWIAIGQFPLLNTESTFSLTIYLTVVCRRFLCLAISHSCFASISSVRKRFYCAWISIVPQTCP